MKTIWANQALTAKGWASHVSVEIGADGRIVNVDEDTPPRGHRVETLLPAPANSHSHAFQRAMAGLTEKRGENPTDSFWTWRKLMYDFLGRVTPDQVEAIAALVQMEMLEAGYATNVEFHYLHHQADGSSYAQLGEMSERIAAAASESGIGLTLLPVQYQYGGCDKRALTQGQLRFGNDPERYARLLDEAGRALKTLAPDARLGVAPHSLRAVAPEQLRDAATLVPEGPVHIHIAEQIPEVEEVQAAWGARPVEWALDNLDLDQRWCMIHATQMLPNETKALAATGAIAGLCPITEASLGDGIFDGVRWMDAGGRISVGSDSNILISLAEEMRVLDTTQRLRDHTRAALADATTSTGRRIFSGICEGGALAAGRSSGSIAVGQWADLLSLDMNHINLAGLRGDTILDSFAFTGDNRMISDVWAAGRHMVRDGAHVRRAEITSRYRKAVAHLREGA
ncbi:formimidoylglutamate deiminase [Shimia sp. CNT1-13L.2]|uniref:formimidoylglutamate deiminase n=1 Tax=Shimia sp. CNT1-13L.2 TaxID=2959663 RepID=UPI0020CBF27F|nr:formimidoylglutamate deiminase [Shimia sp. CNT1-13L.2]MCP9480786.1 formimidoylglutamate deiminase [Shimia sp. CNT1-13L.2]